MTVFKPILKHRNTQFQTLQKVASKSSNYQNLFVKVHHYSNINENLKTPREK